MDTIHKIGRRKTSVARIYMSKGKGDVMVNGKKVNEYFTTGPLLYKINQAFELTETEKQYDLKVNVLGGGITGQAEAIRMAIARALCEVDAEHRTTLKPEGLLTRDPRMVERKKFGQKKARKKFQFSKR
ncbi:30S ribosomal protein S9 [Mesohalobacter halotolerans]|jgi:small subunit ribosomal protein S9|uniref:Small ribosomal subunit protein uS9 n=1 Tax=Mesohalobacter halotolerans TaxID=1883405 RepID=A0A4U5TPL3_9FLAO|nr:30S ribosomal protein S9 [Mesohalobacter halotolerans]MBS3737959.1 30S ribosomal protein S9 [Psychroflexus sp.]NBC58920.1 30S ribosomal protein S9 [Bacteroidota bacterium]TKS56057.1 30S ribosomal protein S9 [Mesohalobacter halotolerans]